MIANANIIIFMYRKKSSSWQRVWYRTAEWQNESLKARHRLWVHVVNGAPSLRMLRKHNFLEDIFVYSLRQKSWGDSSGQHSTDCLCLLLAKCHGCFCFLFCLVVTSHLQLLLSPITCQIFWDVVVFLNMEVFSNLSKPIHTFRCQILSYISHWISYTLKNRGSSLALMVSWITLNIHRTSPFHKRLFIVEKGSLDDSNVFFILF